MIILITIVRIVPATSMFTIYSETLYYSVMTALLYITKTNVCICQISCLMIIYKNRNFQSKFEE